MEPIDGTASGLSECCLQIPASMGVIEVSYQRASNKRRRQGQQEAPRKRAAAPVWPGGVLNRYLRFVLQKENLDTQVSRPGALLTVSTPPSTIVVETGYVLFTTNLACASASLPPLVTMKWLW